MEIENREITLHTLVGSIESGILNKLFSVQWEEPKDMLTITRFLREVDIHFKDFNKTKESLVTSAGIVNPEDCSKEDVEKNNALMQELQEKLTTLRTETKISVDTPIVSIDQLKGTTMSAIELNTISWMIKELMKAKRRNN